MLHSTYMKYSAVTALICASLDVWQSSALSVSQSVTCHNWAVVLNIRPVITCGYKEKYVLGMLQVTDWMSLVMDTCWAGSVLCQPTQHGYVCGQRHLINNSNAKFFISVYSSPYVLRGYELTPRCWLSVM